MVSPARGGRLPADRRAPGRRDPGLAGRPASRSRQRPRIDIPELAARLRRGDVRLLDVRDLDEWEEGHVEGSRHVPYYDLGKGVPDDLRNGGKPLAVACSVGNRSSIAVSLLRRAGVEDVIHVASTAASPSSPDEGIELVQTD